MDDFTCDQMDEVQIAEDAIRFDSWSLAYWRDLKARVIADAIIRNRTQCQQDEHRDKPT